MQTESLRSTGPTSDGIETSAPSTGAMLNQLTLFAEAFPVSRIPLLADEERLKMTATSGPKSSDACAKLGLDGSWVKTSQGFSQARMDGSLEPFCETWPRAGLMSNGIVCQRQPLVPITNAIGSGLWPTPRAYSHSPGVSAPGLTALDIRVRGLYPDKKRYWPTPAASDWKGSVGLSSANKRSAASSRGVRLSEEVTVRDQVNVGGSLNPQWVEWLMGYPLGWTDCEDSVTPSCPR